jgi:hypothetical protein
MFIQNAAPVLKNFPSRSAVLILCVDIAPTENATRPTSGYHGK